MASLVGGSIVRVEIAGLDVGVETPVETGDL